MRRLCVLLVSLLNTKYFPILLMTMQSLLKQNNGSMAILIWMGIYYLKLK